MADPVFIKVGHPYTAKVFKPNLRNGETKQFRARTDIAIRAIGSSEADLVASLGFCGGEIEVYRYEDAFWRPLIHPDHGTPLDVAGLAGYSLGMSSWRDNPFIDRSANHYMLRGGTRTDTSFCAGTENFYASDWRRVAESTLAPAIEEIRAKAGDLLFIEGTAYVRTEPPVCLIKSGLNGNIRGCRLTWHMPYIEGDDDEGGPTTHPYGDSTHRRDYSSYGWRRFQLCDLDAARRFAERLSEVRRQPFDDRTGGIVIHRDDLLPPPGLSGVDPGLIANVALAALKSRVLDLGDRSNAEAWLDARDFISDERVDEAIERLAAIVESGAKGVRWDWKVLDFRNLALTPMLDADDALSQVLRHQFDRDRFGMSADDIAALEDIEELGGPSP